MRHRSSNRQPHPAVLPHLRRFETPDMAQSGGCPQKALGTGWDTAVDSGLGLTHQTEDLAWPGTQKKKKKKWNWLLLCFWPLYFLQKVESGMGCPDWHAAMHNLRLQRFLGIFYPGHAGISGNERADRLASTVDNYHIWSAALQGRGAQRLEERSEHGQADIPPFRVENDLCSTRQILALFRGQP